MSPFSRPQLGQARGVICSALDCAFTGQAFPKLVEGRGHHEGARESAKEAGPVRRSRFSTPWWTARDDYCLCVPTLHVNARSKAGVRWSGLFTSF